MTDITKNVGLFRNVKGEHLENRLEVMIEFCAHAAQRVELSACLFFVVGQLKPALVQMANAYGGFGSINLK